MIGVWPHRPGGGVDHSGKPAPTANEDAHPRAAPIAPFLVVETRAGRVGPRRHVDVGDAASCLRGSFIDGR